MKNLLKIFILTLPLATVQACSNPELNQTENTHSESIPPKKFGDRFSVENIKKEREAFYAQKRIELKRSTPTVDVKNALRNNDVYLMVIPAGRGGSSSIPGLIEPKVTNVNCKTVFVEGMGDILYGKNHMLYRQELLQYMRQFNALMSQYCR